LQKRKKERKNLNLKHNLANGQQSAQNSGREETWEDNLALVCSGQSSGSNGAREHALRHWEGEPKEQE